MIKLKKPQSKIVKFIIIIIVVVLGVIGWQIWQATRPKPQPPEVSQQPETKYLVIPDWGIRLTLTADTHNAFFNSRGASPLLRNLGTRSLTTETGCTNEPAAIIYRVQKDAVNVFNGNKKYTDVETGKVIDDYFYFIKAGAQTCSGNPESEALLPRVKADFMAATPSIEKQ